MINLVWENEQAKFDITDERINILKKCIEATLDEEKLELDCEISLTITDDASIAEINNEMRGKPVPTDVLSFPMLDGKNGELNYQDEDFADGYLILGDIVISIERAVFQAEEYGHSLLRELGFLTVHSMLHLLGYDHEISEAEEKIMFNKQEQILQKINLTR